MEDLVIKTMLLNLTEVRAEFNEMSKSMYNTYKLLGFDVLVQGDHSNLKPYLIEVNARPQLKDDVVDKAVNRPMVGTQCSHDIYHQFLTSEVKFDVV